MIKYTEKLSELLFLEIKPEIIFKVFGYESNNGINLPIRSKRIINDVKNERDFNGFPVSYVIEGMFFLIGADPNFKYNDIYKEMIKLNVHNNLVIKKIIAEEVKLNFIEDAFILLKGLTEVEPIGENYEKLLQIVSELAKNDKEYLNEEKKIIEDAKLVKKFPLVYFYDAVLKQDEEDYESALFLMSQYIEMGGEITAEIKDFQNQLKIFRNYEIGKELSITEPEAALERLLPLLDSLEENPSLYFHIAVSYRNLNSFEKAIYFLNEALSLDSNIVEIYNEFGLNYASLKDYEKAIQYFRKAFEVTRSIEICTNLVLCYYYKGDIDQSKLHLEIAKKIKPNDEIVGKLQSIINQ